MTPQDYRDTALNTKNQTLEQSVVTALVRYLEDLDGEPPNNLYDKVMSEIEKPLLATVLQHCNHNQSRAASYLGINRGTLRKKLRQYQIAP